ncbi:MAG TPA: type II toxin-antitoxin system prevent-host-death family antitoxin [Pyrinomonadaceae bacterium]|jgi:prevent-host-death family protein|nr:type II toxin-antitoxin system prevent-host-death family antitoxin [Pyrinomonadaceae bacterium]
MYRIDLEKAKAQISSLLQTALDGEEIVITQNEQPVLKLMPISTVKPRRQSGSAKGLITMSDNFDEPLEDFAEYMQ